MADKPDRFFLIVSLLLLAIVFVGFAPTFYLRGAIDVSHLPGLDIPAHVVAHGLFMTAWFVVFALQTVLVARGNTARHRSVGVGGVVIAIGVVLTATAVAVQFPARAPAGGFAPGETVFIAVANTFIIPIFAGLFAAAIYFRRRSEIHKRLMLFASLSMMAPAVTTSRVFGALLQPIAPIDLFMMLAIGVLLALIVHDVRRERRVAAPTYVGLAVTVAMFAGIGGVAGSEMGATYHDWLASL